ncbi:unnamed protein product [Clonostachys rosea f. rosea IK726]|uniref:Uncharacterized protein n=1 Tax=Clonostachys rosea f. rosea IK726 TaxID=1349383 RepID=A0ACA9TAD8_BIOOC|nr:unnamed protein product [Clonostachys rosea f. rosea IK726]
MDATVECHISSGEIVKDGKVKASDYKKFTNGFDTSLIDDVLLEHWGRVISVNIIVTFAIA